MGVVCHTVFWRWWDVVWIGLSRPIGVHGILYDRSDGIRWVQDQLGLSQYVETATDSPIMHDLTGVRTPDGKG